jgi:hypothetical protein
LADRTSRIHRASSISGETASNRGAGRIAFNSVSQQPRALHNDLHLAVYSCTNAAGRSCAH